MVKIKVHVTLCDALVLCWDECVEFRGRVTPPVLARSVPEMSGHRGPTTRVTPSRVCPDEDADPLQVFLATEVDKNPRRLIVFIVWLSRRSDAYRHYRRIVLQETDSCVQSLLRLALE